MSIPEALPPSPPSTSSRRKLLFPRSSVTSASTPDSPASFPGSSNGTRKRVEFSPWTNADDPLPSSQQSSDTPAVKALPRSSGYPSSLKSILKPSPADEKRLRTTDVQQEEDLSMNEMMESIVQQLANDERTVSVDAYQTLSRVIRQYDDIPEEAVLRSKVSTILKYIKRDLLRPIEEIADTNLITQALKVLVIFVWNPDYSSVLTDEYRLFILDRSILVLSEHTAPKSVIMHYLHLLATQTFRWNLITSNNRITRLLDALKALSEHIKGNGVLSERLLVYGKLLDQTKATMKGKAALWVEELLTGMTSNMKEVRTKAIDLGVLACAAFPASSSICGTVRNVLERELENGMRFGIAMCRRLEKMIVSKEEMAQVPQIWATVILLSNSVDTRIDDWVDLKEWLKVIQRCFNCSESAVRQQSNLAWNRLVSVVRPHEASETLLSMLSKPITAQLERQSTDKAIKGSRATAVASYCNLLYYAFRPAANHKQYTRVWNEYIVKVMRSPFFEKNTANSDIACRVLIALLWNSSKGTKVWNESRALQDSRSVEPEEIPTLDNKWIRAKCSGVVDMFYILLRYSSWGGSGQSEKAYIAVAWTHFLKALREASSKEIKPSAETKLATATVVSFLERLWGEASHGVTEVEGHTMAQIRQMARSAVVELGYSSILVALETSNESVRAPFIFSETLSSILSEIYQQSSITDTRLHLPSYKNPLQALMPQYEKCLELMTTSVIQEYQSEGRLSAVIEATKSLNGLLPDIQTELLLPTLRKTSNMLTLLLKDKLNFLEHHYEGKNDSTYSNFSTNAVDVLMKVPSTTVEQLDEVFAAMFENRSTSVVNYAIRMWNTTLGQQDSTILGPKLRAILMQLRDLTDVNMPGLPLVMENQEILGLPCPAIYEETPSPASHLSDLLHHDELARLGIPSPILGSQARVTALVAEDRLDDEILSSPVRSTFRPRSRHGDSQIHFVPIESSPQSDQEPESQFLTTHQKDVRDRQRSEPAVVFPDLRSSPRPQSKSQTYGNCEFARKAATLEERPSTPTLPINQDQRELEIMASPTPRARHFATRITDIEVPSSPPSMHDNQEREVVGLDNLSSPPQAAVDDAQMEIEIGLPVSEALGEVDGRPDHSICPTDEVQHLLINHQPIQTSVTTELDKHESDAQMQETEVDQFATAPENEFDTVSNKEANEQSEQRTDSDEIDMLSASQLSQDLDRHLSQSAEIAINQPEMESNSNFQPQDVEEQAQSETRTYNVRKRKASNFVKPAKKRRTKSASQLSSDSIGDENPRSQNASQQEMLDTIEVVTSPAVQAVASASSMPAQEVAVAESTPASRRVRGQPRKHPRSSQSQESPISSQALEAAIVPMATYFKRENDDDALSTGVDDTVEEQNELVEVMVMEEETTPNIQVATPPELEVDDTNQKHAGAAGSMVIQQDTDEPAPPTYLSALEMALKCLNSETPENIDLRAVDELCFQIRFNAQLRAQQLHTGF